MGKKPLISNSMLIAVLLVLFFPFFLSAQISYHLIYKDSSSSLIKISIQPSAPMTAPFSFIMPRSIPGGHDIFIYDKFIKNIHAISSDGKNINMTKDVNDAPRWYCNDSGSQFLRIEYEVDLDKMERHLAAGDASIIRPGFVGILNYSVFGWIDGTEQQTAVFTGETFSNWSIFATNQPDQSPAKGTFSFKTLNYYALADGQLFLGTNFRIKEYKAIVPLFIVSYCQMGDEYLDDYGKQGITSMEILKDYFGEIPFRRYSIMLRKALPLEPGTAPSLAMEHLQSSTFFGDTTGMRKEAMSQQDILRTMPTYLHHMSHAFIPLRCYGDTYRPYVMEITPIINNIWLNEGFMWFLAYDTLKNERLKTNFYNSTYKTSSIIKRLSLQQLSQTASTMYSSDFRIGRAIYSRGALMAIEMNDYLKGKSGGTKSMKDVFRYLYNWSKENKRPFTMEEFPSLINKACNIDLSAIYQKWQLPIE